MLLWNGDSGHGQHPFRAPDRHIKAFGAGQGVRGGAGVFVVLEHPLGYRPLRRPSASRKVLRLPIGVLLHLPEGAVLTHRIEQKPTLQQLAKLGGGHGQDGLGVLRLLQLPAGLQQHLGPVGLTGALDRLPLDAGGQGAAQQGHHEHDGEGCEIAGIAHQSEIGVGKEEIKYQHGEQGGHQAVCAPCGHHSDSQHPQDIDHDHVGGIEAQLPKPVAHGGAEGQDAQCLHGVRQCKTLLDPLYGAASPAR